MNEAALARILAETAFPLPQGRAVGPGIALRGTDEFPETLSLLLGLPLNRFAVEGCPLEIRVPWFQATLWFVPSEADAEDLARDGVSRGRIWTASELEDLMTDPSLTKAQIQRVGEVKAIFGGRIITVNARSQGPMEKRSS